MIFFAGGDDVLRAEAAAFIEGFYANGAVFKFAGGAEFLHTGLNVGMKFTFAFELSSHMSTKFFGMIMSLTNIPELREYHV